MSWDRCICENLPGMDIDIDERDFGLDISLFGYESNAEIRVEIMLDRLLKNFKVKDGSSFTFETDDFDEWEYILKDGCWQKE